MTESRPGHASEPPAEDSGPARSRVRAAALWVTVGVLIAGAVLGGVFIILGNQSGVVGRAFLTLLLVGLFAMAVLIDGRAPGGPNCRWYLPASTLLNVLLLVIGLIKLWNGPLQPGDTVSSDVWSAQTARWLGNVAIVRLALLSTQLYVPPFVVRAKMPITRLAGQLTVGLIWLTALVYLVPLSFPNLRPLGVAHYAGWWWRISGATALVAAVCVVIPLVVRAFEPKAAALPAGDQRPAPLPGPAQQQEAWRQYAQQQEAWRHYEQQKRAWDAYLAAEHAATQPPPPQ